MIMTNKVKRFIRGLAENKLFRTLGWVDTTNMVKRAIFCISEKKTKEHFIGSVACNSSNMNYKKNQEKAEDVWTVVSDYFKKVKRNPETQEYYVDESV